MIEPKLTILFTTGEFAKGKLNNGPETLDGLVMLFVNSFH